MNDKDFDDLFRQASEQYPLRTDSVDWDRVAAALNETDDRSLAMIPLYSEEGRGGRRRFLWLLLLIPLAGVVYYFMNGSKATEKYPLISKAGITSSQINAGSGSVRALNNHKENGKMPTASVAAASSLPKAQLLLTSFSDPALSLFKPGQKRKTAKGSNAVQENDLVKNMLPALLFSPEEIHVDDISLMDAGRKNNAVKTTLTTVDSSSAQKTKAVVKIKQRSRSYFYAGVIAAPDISTIKFQKTAGTGYTAGALFGYAISPKIAIESGVYFDRKKYYSSGEYFSKKNVPYLNNVDVLSVDGACNMIEVPLNIRYTIYNGKKTKWFATTGMSSYFIFKDAYNYDLKRGSNTWSRYWSYKKSSQNWFSVINISAGYEQRLGKIGSLRLEPYLRLPLSGMGTGSLHIMSTGFNVGFTRRIN